MFFVALLLLVSVYFSLNLYSHKVGLDIYRGWKESEIINVQQGNLLAAVTKAQRILVGSDHLSGILLIDLEDNKTLIEYGQAFPAMEITPSERVNVYPNGLFSFTVAEVINQNRPFLLRFDFRPKFLPIVFVLFFIMIFVFSILLWVLISRVELIESREREQLLCLAIENLLRNENLSEVLEIRLPFLVSQWTSMKNELRNVNELKSQVITASKLSELAAQVSHDIRSPLTALNLVVSTVIGLSEEHRVLIKNSASRITDIANQLLEKSRTPIVLLKSDKTTTLTEEIADAELMTLELLPSLIDVLVSEKRIQYRCRMNIRIETDLEESYGAFALVNSGELKRVLSNLINNSVEAMEERPNSQVTVSVKKYSTKILLTVRDNGCGIPSHLLTRLGEKGVTFGKSGTLSGSGLGIFHAKRTIESFGATFNINSQEQIGTEVRMTFKVSSYPDWFLDQLNLKANQTVVVLDDDSAIHAVWSEKLKKERIVVVSLTSGDALENWVKEKGDQLSKYLVDYELIGQNRTGLDLIDELGIATNSVLVTSRFEDEIVRSKCDALKIKLLPKTMAYLLPIVIQ